MKHLSLSNLKMQMKLGKHVQKGSLEIDLELMQKT